MRFAVSLKRSADPDGGQEWQLKHFSSANFGTGPLSGVQVSGVFESIEMDPVRGGPGRGSERSTVKVWDLRGAQGQLAVT